MHEELHQPIRFLTTLHYESDKTQLVNMSNDNIQSRDVSYSSPVQRIFTDLQRRKRSKEGMHLDLKNFAEEVATLAARHIDYNNSRIDEGDIYIDRVITVNDDNMFMRILNDMAKTYMRIVIRDANNAESKN